MSRIDISGIEKLNLLKALWDNSCDAAFFKVQAIGNGGFDYEAGRKAIKYGYIDYFCGRIIKADLSGDYCEGYYTYNVENGKGKFEAVVEAVRKNQKKLIK